MLGGINLNAYADTDELQFDDSVDESVIEDALTYRGFRLTVVSSVYPTAFKEPWPDKINMYWPTRSQHIDSGYGYRFKPCAACSSNHLGVDFSHERGTEVYAAMDGIITQMQHSGGFGYHIYIEHLVPISDGTTERWTTVYAHMTNNSSPIELKIGSAVKAGELIGQVGNTGTSTGPHLHFELLVDGENVDPELYLKIYGY